MSETNTTTKVFTVRAFPNREQRDMLNGTMFLCCDVFNCVTQKRREQDEYVKNNLPDWAFYEKTIEKGKRKGEIVKASKKKDMLTKEENAMLKDSKSELYKKAAELFPEPTYKHYSKKTEYKALLESNKILTKKTIDKYFISSAISYVEQENLKTQRAKVADRRKKGLPADYKFAKKINANSFRVGSKIGDWKIVKKGKRYYLYISKFSDQKNNGPLLIKIDKQYWREKFGGITEGKSCVITRDSVSVNNSKYYARLTITI